MEIDFSCRFCYDSPMARVNLKEKWRLTPHCPGVYLMKGEGGEVASGDNTGGEGEEVYTEPGRYLFC